MTKLSHTELLVAKTGGGSIQPQYLAIDGEVADEPFRICKELFPYIRVNNFFSAARPTLPRYILTAVLNITRPCHWLPN